MGFEPIPRFSRERILSPLRLPFRHIGALYFTTENLVYLLYRNLKFLKPSSRVTLSISGHRSSVFLGTYHVPSFTSLTPFAMRSAS
jgi:hypothetical protein